jgi:hypothetical protein
MNPKDLVYMAILLIATLVIGLGAGVDLARSNVRYLANNKPDVCRQLGGVLDSRPDGSTVCVFRKGTVPP